MNKFEEEFDYLIKLFGKVQIRQIEVEEFEKHREIFLKKYSEKQQAEVPEFVAEWIKKLKLEKREPLENPMTFGEVLSGLSENALEKAFNWIRANQETYIRAWLNGYTVTKEKQFYLRHKSVLVIDSGSDTSSTVGLYLASDDNFVPYQYLAKKFTQQEIENMNNESYEQIEVK